MKNLKWAAVFFLLVIACIATVVLRQSLSPTAKSAKIIQNGEVIREVILQSDTPYEFTITSPEGGYNTVRVEHGKIGITEADCPDKLCVRQGLISSGAMPVVCLPHRLSIIIDGENNGVDAVSGGISQ